MIDSHTHLNFHAFASDWEKVVDRAVENGVTSMIVVGTDLESSKKAVAMAQKNQFLYASVGVHPHHARGIKKPKVDLSEIEKSLTFLASQPKVVAIGEIGLDRHHYQISKYINGGLKTDNKSLFKLQKYLFRMQVKIARKLNLPLILHSREVNNDVLDLLLEQDDNKTIKIKGVFHCFEGNKKYLNRIIKAGFYVSYTGNITYSKDRLALAGMTPLDRLLIETDSPYLSPEPFRGERNEPVRVKIVAEHLALIHRVQLSKVIEETTMNARLLFNI
jgi:TatD DNase family protein